MKRLIAVWGWFWRGMTMKLKAKRWSAYTIVFGFALIGAGAITLFPPDEVWGMPTLTPVYILPVAIGYWFLKHGPYEGPMFLGVALGIAIAAAISYPVVQDWTVWDALGRWALETFFSIGGAFFLLLMIMYASGVPSIQFPEDSTSRRCPYAVMFHASGYPGVPVPPTCGCSCPCRDCGGEEHRA